MEDLFSGVVAIVKWLLRLLGFLLEVVIDIIPDIIHQKIPERYRWLFWLLLIIVFGLITYWAWRSIG